MTLVNSSPIHEGVSTGENKTISDFSEFAARVGLMTDYDDIKQTGALYFAKCDSSGLFDTGDLMALNAFCQAKPQFHLATVTSESDDVESELCKELAEKEGLTWNEMTEEEQINFRESREISVYTIDNQVRVFNRMGYFLCSGDNDNELCLVERFYYFDEK